MSENMTLTEEFLKKLGAVKASCMVIESVSRDEIGAEDLELVNGALECLDGVLSRHGFDRRD